MLVIYFILQLSSSYDFAWVENWGFPSTSAVISHQFSLFEIHERREVANGKFFKVEGGK